MFFSEILVNFNQSLYLCIVFSDNASFSYARREIVNLFTFRSLARNLHRSCLHGDICVGLLAQLVRATDS